MPPRRRLSSPLPRPDYAFDAPDTIPVGLTTFQLVNDGDHLHNGAADQTREQQDTG